MSTARRPRDQPAAGGLLWRPTHGRLDEPPDSPGAVELALVHRARYDDWTFPKGKVDPGEQLVVTARREVAEETGWLASIGRPVGETRYALPTMDGPRHGYKFVRYWAMRATLDGAAVGSLPAPDPDEVDEVRWLAPEEAERCLSYRHDVRLLRRALRRPLGATTVLLVRHGHAGDKKSWHAPDDLRPLDELGRDQASRLRAVVPCWAPRRVLSAEPVRCLETVAPVADALGLAVEVEPAMGRQAFAAAPAATVARVHELARDGDPVVLCSQGEVIPGLLRALGWRKPQPATRKGSLWALTFDGDELVVADYDRDLAPDR